MNLTIVKRLVASKKSWNDIKQTGTHSFERGSCHHTPEVVCTVVLHGDKHHGREFSSNSLK